MESIDYQYRFFPDFFSTKSKPHSQFANRTKFIFNSQDWFNYRRKQDKRQIRADAKAFTSKQCAILEQVFRNAPFPTIRCRLELATQLRSTEATIQVCIQCSFLFPQIMMIQM